MKVMTFNIQHARNFLTGKIDIPLMAKTIQDLGADVCVMQEVYGKGEGESFVGQSEKIAEMLGFHHYFAKAIDIGTKGPYGNAIVSRFPITFSETIAVPSAPRIFKGYYEDRCLLNTVVKSPEGDIQILGCHFGLMPNEAELCAKTVCDAISPDMPTVFMGDLNLTPDSELLDPVRHVLVDTDNFYKGENNLTFPSDKPDIKIDYIFVSSDIKVNDVQIPSVIAADHLPIVADISF